MLKVALICGGPSEERGISLNSARSFLDHTSSLDISLHVFYCNLEKKYYPLTPSQLYSNTPSDFDFKLSEKGKSLSNDDLALELQKMDLVVPLIHGIYGEDGELQEWLEQHQIPFLGSSSTVCKGVFHKYTAKLLMKEFGFSGLPALRVMEGCETNLQSFWDAHRLQKAIVKPTLSGSTIGVTLVESFQEAKEQITNLFDQGFKDLIVEPYSEMREFTICVVENTKGEPVSLIPLEIEVFHPDDKILTYRRKYLPSTESRYHCPPRFPLEHTQKIRKEAESLFKQLGLRDVARIDGWISHEGKIYFSDFNPLSGMEQNSFLFQQAAQASLSHSDLLQVILQRALNRYGDKKICKKEIPSQSKKPVYILMGGKTAERHVSIMSGTNVWLKLLSSNKYQPTPFLLDKNHEVWSLPYSYTLHHTAEEMMERCHNHLWQSQQQGHFVSEIRQRLGFLPLEKIEKPQSSSLEDFLDLVQRDRAFLFIALHGGIGEDGTIQKLLEERNICFNGSSSTTSELCMDKYNTSLAIASIGNSNILPMPQFSLDPFQIVDDEQKQHQVWLAACATLGSKDLLIKPRSDGCSAGVVRLRHEKDFQAYLNCLKNKVNYVPEGTFSHQPTLIEMPQDPHMSYVLEPFIHTDKIFINGVKLYHEKVSGWCEVTIGVIEKQGEIIALSPSMTIAKSHVLSVEEKFQGGTGVNITPPPRQILSLDVVAKVQGYAVEVAQKLRIQNYARLDLFVECSTGRIRFIEANTLPALTPSTVIYHQALTLEPPLNPTHFLEQIIDEAQWNHLKQKMDSLTFSDKEMSAKTV